MKKSQVRDQIIEYLANYGPVEDVSGGATAVLRERLGYEGTTAAFTQLVAALGNSGELQRTIKGKRTYRIAAGASSTDSSEARPKRNPTIDRSLTLTPDAIDYDELAYSLLARIATIISDRETQGEENRPHADSKSENWAVRRIQKLDRRVKELEKEIARERALQRLTAEERDSYRQKFEHSVGNLAVLAESSSGKKKAIDDRLGDDDRLLLQRLLTSSTFEPSEQAG